MGCLPGERVSFLSLPVELIDSFVLPHLEWNDLLRFRRVCKWTKEITHGYLKVHPELAPEIQIDEEGDRNLNAFVEMNIPTSRIFFNNLSGDEFYLNLGIDGVRFVVRFGGLIKHLRVAQVSRYMHGRERKFLNLLRSLETFEAGHFGYGRKVGESEIEGVLEKQKDLMLKDPLSINGLLEWCPMSFRNLKTIKISHNEDIVFGNFLQYNDALILGMSITAPSLEYLMFPISLKPQGTSSFGEEAASSLMSVACRYAVLKISERQRTKAIQWKTIDFGGFHGNEESMQVAQRYVTSAVFLRLCERSLQNNVKLRNVHSLWLRTRHIFPDQDSPQLGIPIVSMINLHPWILPLELENLEKLEIRETSKSSVGSDWIWDRRDWPALKCLDITVNSKQGRYSRVSIGNGGNRMIPSTTSTKSLFQFLFREVNRAGVEELRLNFTKEKKQVYVPNVEDIVAACPNLKKLTIINWPGGNKDLVKFWEGLGKLEELQLESCKNLDDSAFLGEDETIPAFMKLTKLRSLTLKGLEKMPNITDKLFTSAVRHMNLKRLILTSDSPLKSITFSGVQSLMEGSFAQTIEKFPFQEWSLAGVADMDFRELEMKFRSYRML